MSKIKLEASVVDDFEAKALAYSSAFEEATTAAKQQADAEVATWESYAAAEHTADEFMELVHRVAQPDEDDLH